LLKENLLYLLAKTDDEDFNKFSKQIVSNSNELNNVQPDMQKPVYTSLLRNGNMDTVNQFINLYEKSHMPEEKERIAILLAEVVSEELINFVLEFSLSVIQTKFMFNFAI
jgi:hypothetical protein